VLAAVCVEFTAVGCTVLEPAFVFTPVFVDEAAPADTTGVAAEEPLLPLPLLAALLPPAALLLTTPVLTLVLVAPVLAVPPLAHPLTFPPD
jgi:hypothetical protein